MSTVVEKVIIPLLILTCIAISIYNPMKFELLSQILLGSLVIGSLFLLGFWLHRQNKISSPLLNSPTNVHSFSSPSFPDEVAPTSPMRVDGDISPILSLFHTHTVSQMNNLLNPYKDQFVRFSGVVDNVFPPGDRGPQVTVYFLPDGSTSRSYIKFGKEWNSYFHTIQKGANLTVAAKIDKIDTYGVDFKDGSIIP